MVTIALIAAAVLIAALGAAHSILGEKYIIGWLLTHDLPRLFGGTSFTAGTIRFAWHRTTVLFVGLAGVLLAIALGAPTSTVLVGDRIHLHRERRASDLVHAGTALIVGRPAGGGRAVLMGRRRLLASEFRVTAPKRSSPAGR
ncbi:hypothetical protein [Microbacterium sp. AK031]|uniref:hypothetical protein n=1 Tax=Microbacterium sp. AK031 TaxID=2723076 RepID=UPI00216A8CCD|nr:hypothetical protein [Microbacterium sp. AK031]MCS3843319.1 hypothetical protein [Microbacterium sp. AK031]